ncbi:MAG: FAD-binding oxidoreductase [Acidobacteria bacterium]|nr:FAD-binding oxidoreductase [Acidobacteriota bacterium]
MKPDCRIIRREDPGFRQAVTGTLFNKRPLDRWPAMICYPRTVADVRDLVLYAKSLEKKISICSGGHSWSANHVRDDAVLIDLSNFNEYAIDAAKMTATAGPAVGGSVLMTELFKRELFFPAGHCRGVCLGGYLLQGGFAWNGPKLGLACESVIGIDVVTADGEYLHCDERENADLFWAARGAGPGFFGVVVRFHLKLYRRPKYYGMIGQVFRLKHLEEVYRWAYEIGPRVPRAVEFQMLMTPRTLKFLAPGIEVAAPIFAESKAELDEARAFLDESPIRHKAFFRTPFVRMGMKTLYRFAMSHYPAGHCWNVDNMWTSAPVDELIEFHREIAAALPPAPSHVLWLNWQPPVRRTEMSFSVEDRIYISLYAGWKAAADTARYGSWATDLLKKYAHLGSGIQLADENLNNRPARFLAAENLRKLDEIRQTRDSAGRFHEWHGRPPIED